MNPALKERVAYAFPYILAAALPLAGVLLAALWFMQDRRQEGGYVFLAAALGGLIYAILLTG